MEDTVDKAVAFLTSKPIPRLTYEAACLAKALQEVHSGKYMKTIQKYSEFLENAQLPNGMWIYGKIDDKR